MNTTQSIVTPSPQGISSQLVPQVERIGSQIARVLKHYVFRRNADGEIRAIPLRAIYLVADHNEPYAAIEVDVNRLGPGVRLHTLLEKDLVHDIRIATGCPVWAVEQNGVTYVISLNKRPPARLPKRINLNLADRPAGQYVIGFGLACNGPIWRELSRLTHILVAGSSDSGKSAFLRSLVWQAHNQPLPVNLYLTDLEGLTFTAPCPNVDR